MPVIIACSRSGYIFVSLRLPDRSMDDSICHLTSVQWARRRARRWCQEIVVTAEKVYAEEMGTQANQHASMRAKNPQKTLFFHLQFIFIKEKYQNWYIENPLSQSLTHIPSMQHIRTIMISTLLAQPNTHYSTTPNRTNFGLSYILLASIISMENQDSFRWLFCRRWLIW